MVVVEGFEDKRGERWSFVTEDEEERQENGVALNRERERILFVEEMSLFEHGLLRKLPLFN